MNLDQFLTGWPASSMTFISRLHRVRKKWERFHGVGLTKERTGKYRHSVKRKHESCYFTNQFFFIDSLGTSLKQGLFLTFGNSSILFFLQTNGLDFLFCQCEPSAKLWLHLLLSPTASVTVSLHLRGRFVTSNDCRFPPTTPLLMST